MASQRTGPLCPSHHHEVLATRLALFSDVHGRLRVVLRCMMCWQLKHKKFLDGALIAGDLGCFPDPSRFDDATKRWAKRDPEEAGFSTHFVEPTPQVESLMQKDPSLGPYSEIKCSVFFVAGNHEDYDYLKRAQRQNRTDRSPKHTFFVDCYRRFFCIDDGCCVSVEAGNGDSLSIGGLWGIHSTREGAPYKIDRESVDRLMNSDGDIDLLLTHDAPSGVFPGGGSPEITEIIRHNRPQFHVFGHVHPEEAKHCYTASDLSTECWVFEDVSFGKHLDKHLGGAMGILTRQDTPTGPHASEMDQRICAVEEKWLFSMRSETWKHILPML